MLFKSRQPKNLSQKCTEAVWPSMGLRRSTLYWGHRIVRLKDSNYKIAAGLALGAAISFTPLPGVHVIGAIMLCMLSRARIIAGVIGTVVGNPWTIPFMWYFAYWIGKISFVELGLPVRHMPPHFEWRELVAEITHDPMSLFAPWLTGGFILMILSWPIFYVIFHFLIEHLRATHHIWKRKRIHKEARLITGQAK